tara:strand:- start:119 stop:832 length:714 start_codon:yes stop_codon:yes gene_type:complete
MLVEENLSPNYSNKPRSIRKIKFVIIHYTGMQSEIESIKRLKDLRSKVSCHYLINRKGKIFQMVKDTRVAWHAGKSKWKKFENLNNNSLGIELVNKGHRYGYQSFNTRQITSLIWLCKKLKKKYAIKKENFLGHSDIAPLRKKDPGEKFPWKKLNTYKIGKWYKEHYLKYELNTKHLEILFFRNLHKLGYRYFNTNKRSHKDKMVIKSFQQHYLPNNVTGRIDNKTFIISHFLINSS